MNVFSKGSLGGSKTTPTNERTDVLCWEQNASHAEILAYEKRGIVITRKVYFLINPGVTARHEILVTERAGVAVAAPIPLTVRSKALPDASAGVGVVWKVMCDEVTSDRD